METFLAGMSHQEKQSGRALDSQTTYTPKQLLWPGARRTMTALLTCLFIVLLVDSTAAVLVSIAEQ